MRMTVNIVFRMNRIGEYVVYTRDKFSRGLKNSLSFVSEQNDRIFAKYRKFS